MKSKKPSAADRTVNMFGPPVELNIVAEPEERGEHGERVPLEDEVDALRAKTFRTQEWSSKHFPKSDAGGVEYRVSKSGSHYYVESVATLPGGKTAYGYSGVMVHESNLYNLVTVLVQAVRQKQRDDANGFG